MQTVWPQQFHLAGATVRWRQAGELPTALTMVQSPYDPEVRYSEKGATHWEGYKVHFTESCDEGLPHLITQVTTTAAPVPDCTSTAPIQANLAETGRLPGQHIVDGGYTSADDYVQSQSQHGVLLVGPTTPDVSWQAKAADGFDQTHFRLDWQQQQATCPAGKTSQRWLPETKAADNPSILIRFDPKDCTDCPLRTRCTRALTGPRSLRILPQPQFEALQVARQQQLTPAFQALYRQRAGIEGTLSQALRTADLRFARFLGQAKTHLQNVATGTALTLLRLADFLMGRQPARTRLSAFARLAPT